jgi:hypothetical protein
LKVSASQRGREIQAVWDGDNAAVKFRDRTSDGSECTLAAAAKAIAYCPWISRGVAGAELNREIVRRMPARI